MTSHNQPDVGDNTKAAAQSAEGTAVQNKLYDDLQGKFFPGSGMPDNVNKLVSDGVLPAGSTIIDLGKVKEHLAADEKALKDDQNKTPADTKDASKTLEDAKGKQEKAGQSLDKSQHDVEKVQKQIDDRKAQDAQVKKDFDTVDKQLKQGEYNKDSLQKIADDPQQPQAVRDAAGRLKDTFHESQARNGRGGGFHNVENDDYGDSHWYNPTKLNISAESIASGTAKHDVQNAADQKTLDPLVKTRDQAKLDKTAADGEVTKAQTGLDNLIQQNKDLADDQTKLKARIDEEKAALTPDGSLDKAGRVVKGGGYYQVAENLLGIDEKKGVSTEQAKELKMLTRLLQDEERKINGGKLPAFLKTDDQLLAPDHLHEMMEKLKSQSGDQNPVKKEVPEPKADATVPKHEGTIPKPETTVPKAAGADGKKDGAPPKAAEIPPVVKGEEKPKKATSSIDLPDFDLNADA